MSSAGADMTTEILLHGYCDTPNKTTSAQNLSQNEFELIFFELKKNVELKKNEKQIELKKNYLSSTCLQNKIELNMFFKNCLSSKKLVCRF